MLKKQSKNWINYWHRLYEWYWLESIWYYQMLFILFVFAQWYSPSEDRIIPDYNDTWEDYQESEQIKLGLYYVITEDTKLFKKSSYYSTSFIKKTVKEGIDFKITNNSYQNIHKVKTYSKKL